MVSGGLNSSFDKVQLLFGLAGDGPVGLANGVIAWAGDSSVGPANDCIMLIIIQWLHHAYIYSSLGGFMCASKKIFLDTLKNSI